MMILMVSNRHRFVALSILACDAYCQDNLFRPGQIDVLVDAYRISMDIILTKSSL